jgi:hypothetical protein
LFLKAKPGKFGFLASPNANATELIYIVFTHDKPIIDHKFNINPDVYRSQSLGTQNFFIYDLNSNLSKSHHPLIELAIRMLHYKNIPRCFREIIMSFSYHTNHSYLYDRRLIKICQQNP